MILISLFLNMFANANIKVDVKAKQPIVAPTKPPVKKAVERRKYVSLALPKSSVRKNEQATFEARRKYAFKIEKTFDDLKLPNHMRVAILANVWEECRWNPRASSGNFHGPYQMNSRGMGRNLSRNQRHSINDTSHVLKNTTGFKRWLKMNKGKTCAHYASYTFARYVLVCSSRYWNKRGNLGQSWYKKVKTTSYKKN